MRKAGLVIIVLGLVITLITSISFFTKEKVVDLGELEIHANKKHSLSWSPLIGVGVMAVGAVLMLMGPKKL